MNVINGDYLEDISVVIEEFEGFDEDDCYCAKSVMYVNGDLVDSDGSHIKALLEHLGYNADVQYI